MHSPRQVAMDVVKKVSCSTTRKALAHPLCIGRARLIRFGADKSIQLGRSQAVRCFCEFLVVLSESADPLDKSVGANVVTVVEAGFQPDLAIGGQQNPLCCQSMFERNACIRLSNPGKRRSCIERSLDVVHCMRSQWKTHQELVM